MTNENQTEIAEKGALKVGEKFPDFELPVVYRDENGVQTSTRTLANFAGKAFVLFVYPKDATSGCTIEVCGFRDLHDAFRVLDIEIVGLSRDSVGAHRKFIDAQDLPYSLLADKAQDTLRAWDLIGHKTMYGKPVTTVKRTTFLVDDAGIVRQIWQNVTPLGHAQEVLEAAQQLLKKQTA